ncbi:hypothetical protein FOZ61_009234 [Perkinsus olseni]|uniref:Uncharacterized protein n=1 Tax=Perkinsus olseni TaxID=32597 RepID=A0A7J6M5L1_PEROL|nr:hypothetical protein FOZ61_009234 [Perkinsus olseni]KAF4671883.1 hypothetical protein FOL46_009792 [Perkinsus olseni]
MASYFSAENPVYTPVRRQEDLDHDDGDFKNVTAVEEANAIASMLPSVVEQESPQQLASFIIEMSNEISKLEERLRLEQEKNSSQANEILLLEQQLASLPSPPTEVGPSSDASADISAQRDRASSSSVKGKLSPAEIFAIYGINESCRKALNKSPLLATRSRRQRVADMFMAVLQEMDGSEALHQSGKEPSSDESPDYNAIFVECMKAVQRHTSPSSQRKEQTQEEAINDEATLQEVDAIKTVLFSVVEQESPQQLASFIIEMSNEISKLEERLRLEQEKSSSQANKTLLLEQQLASLPSPPTEVGSSSGASDNESAQQDRRPSPPSVKGMKSPGEVAVEYGISGSSRAAYNSPLLATRSRRQRVADMFMAVLQEMDGSEAVHQSGKEFCRGFPNDITPDYNAIATECMKAVRRQIYSSSHRKWVPKKGE